MEHKERIKSPLDLFREEISEWVKGEVIKMAAKEKYDPHAEEINPGQLTDTDRVIWNKLQDRTLTREDIETHQQRIMDEATKQDPGTGRSRKFFLAMIINKADFVVRREMEEELRKELDHRKQNQ